VTGPAVSKAATAWANLQAALEVSDPACLGDPRFTAETPDEDGTLARVCAGCRVREQCLAWALAAPKMQRYGFFAGVSRRGHTGRLQASKRHTRNTR
jgi:hypothetical protein